MKRKKPTKKICSQEMLNSLKIAVSRFQKQAHDSDNLTREAIDGWKECLKEWKYSTRVWSLMYWLGLVAGILIGINIGVMLG